MLYTTLYKRCIVSPARSTSPKAPISSLFLKNQKKQYTKMYYLRDICLRIWISIKIMIYFFVEPDPSKLFMQFSVVKYCKNQKICSLFLFQANEQVWNSILHAIYKTVIITCVRFKDLDLKLHQNTSSLGIRSLKKV